MAVIITFKLQEAIDAGLDTSKTLENFREYTYGCNKQDITFTLPELQTVQYSANPTNISGEYIAAVYLTSILARNVLYNWLVRNNVEFGEL